MKFQEDYLKFERLQENLKVIVKETFNNINHLNELLNAKILENEILTTKNNQLIGVINDLKSKLICSKCNEIQNCGPTEFHDGAFANHNKDDNDLEKEIEENCILAPETESVPYQSPSFINESPPKFDDRLPFHLKNRSITTRNILNEIFGARSTSSGPSVVVDSELAEESPQHSPVQDNYCFIPETMALNEITPKKNNDTPTVSTNSRRQLLLDPNETEENAKITKPQTMPRIRVTPIKNLLEKKTDQKLSQLISPCKSPFNKKLGNTPKRKASSPMKSPLQTTPRKLLKKSHRRHVEISHKGTRKLTQTQLNVACFTKKEDKNAIIFASPEKPDDENWPEPSKSNEKSPVKPSSPLNTSHLQNSPDLNETNLSMSALKKVAPDIKNRPLKQELMSSYDRIPTVDIEVKTKEARKKLPGQVCLNCVRWYEHFGNGDDEEMQRIIDKCSRHRTKRVSLPETPEGFWKPIISPTQKSP